MVEFHNLKGRILISELKESDQYQSTKDSEESYREVVFLSEDINLRFYSANRGHIPFSEEYLMEEYGNKIYFPYYDETKAELIVGDPPENIQEYAKDVSILYAILDENMYIRSESESTAYGGCYIVRNQEIYKISRPIAVTGNDEQINSDNYLNLKSVENPVMVKNVRTGVKVPLEMERVKNVIEEDRSGVLKLREPNSVLSQSIKNLVK